MCPACAASCTVDWKWWTVRRKARHMLETAVPVLLGAWLAAKLSATLDGTKMHQGEA